MEIVLGFMTNNVWLSVGITLWVLISIAVVITDIKNKALGFRIVPKILFLPIFVTYMCTISLFIMPLMYGDKKLGIVGYVPTWLLYTFLGMCFSWWIKSIGENIEELNQVSNGFMGWDKEQGVSSKLGDMIDNNNAPYVGLLHCRLLAIYDRRGCHCSKLATRLF